MKILKEYQYKGYDIEYPTHGGAYGVTVAKGGRVVREFADEHDAEEWIDEEVGDNESLNETKELDEATGDYSGIPLIDRIDFRNKKVNGMPGIYPTKDFVKALNDVGEDFFKVRTTKFGSNLSDADLNDEWMTLKRYGWSIQRVNDSSLEGFNEVYLCKKIKQQESLDEALSPEDAGVSSVFSDLIQKEYDLIGQYDSAQITLEDNGDHRFSEIFEYIKDDINIHIGMLQSCMEDLNGSEEQAAIGEQRADELLNLDESLFESRRDPEKEIILDAIDTFIDLGGYDIDPSKFGTDSWEELRDQIEMGIDYFAPEMAQCIKDYLEKDIQFDKKHPEMFEEDPEAGIRQDIYDDMNRILARYE